MSPKPHVAKGAPRIQAEVSLPYPLVIDAASVPDDSVVLVLVLVLVLDADGRIEMCCSSHWFALPQSSSGCYCSKDHYRPKEEVRKAELQPSPAEAPPPDGINPVARFALWLQAVHVRQELARTSNLPWLVALEANSGR